METESELADTDVSHPSSPVNQTDKADQRSSAGKGSSPELGSGACEPRSVVSRRSTDDSQREQIPLDDQANKDSNPEPDWVKYQGHVYRVAYRDGNILHLRQSGFSKIVHKVHISQVEVKEWK